MRRARITLWHERNICHNSAQRGKSPDAANTLGFETLLLADGGDVVAALGENGIRSKFDLGYHTKHVDTIFKRVFGD